MKKSHLLSILFLFLVTLLQAQNKRESFRIFGIKVKAKDITGIRNFNEMGLKRFTYVINGLTEDSASYLWRLGSVRLNYDDYTDGTFDLFNLSGANHTGGFPLLDSIDFTYYREWGFQILENRNPGIFADSRYGRFKESISNPRAPLNERRRILWDDSYKDFREKLLLSRVFVNTQVVALNKKIVRKFSANIQATLKSNLIDLMKVAASVTDTVSHQKVDSLKLAVFFSRSFERTVDLHGSYITAVLQNEYLNKLSTIVAGIDGSTAIADPTLDEFNFYLLDYMQGPKSNEYATNSALIAFKFTGTLNKAITNKDSLAVTLSALFNIGSQQAAALAATADLVFSKQVTETLQNQFAKVWLIKFGSDEKFEKLHFKAHAERLIGK
jgi:hypothetical protein